MGGSGGAGKGHITHKICEISTEVARSAEYQRPPGLREMWRLTVIAESKSEAREH